MSEEKKNNVVVLTDEEGNEKEFEHIDTVEDNGNVYLAFIPSEFSEEEEAEVVLLKIVEQDGLEALATIDDDEEFDRVSAVFWERIEEMADEEGDEE